MATTEIVRAPVRLTIPGPIYEKLIAHLFPGDGDEHGAVILAGIAQSSSGTRLLARELVLAQDGIDYVAGERGYRMLTASFILEQIQRCSDEKLVYLAVHNHGGTDSVAFSPTDLASHERGYPALLDNVDGLPVGALVFARNAVAGDIWNADRTRCELESATILGENRTVLRPQPEPPSFLWQEKYDRQILLFGERGQEILGNVHVGIVGLGGVGSVLAELLARLGVGRFTLIDPDRIEESNLPRLIGAKANDAGIGLFQRILARIGIGTKTTAKVEHAARLIKAANPSANVRILDSDFLRSEGAGAILDVDYAFLAADTHQVRLLFNAIVHQYLIPGCQIGSKISHDKINGAVNDVFSAHRPLTTYTGCLICNGLIDFTKLSEESLSKEERIRQRYIEGEDLAAPSVIGLNALGAAHAVNRFMSFMTGIGRAESDFTIQHILTNEFEICEPRTDTSCADCSLHSYSRLGKGDLHDLPTKSG